MNITQTISRGKYWDINFSASKIEIYTKTAQDQSRAVLIPSVPLESNRITLNADMMEKAC